MFFCLSFSDEGDTSSSDDEGKDSVIELEGPCCQPLKVPNPSPILPKKLNKNKKVTADKPK